MDITTILMIVGFMIAAYAIISNDAIQTLGTFLASNSHRPAWLLWIFATLVLVGTVLYSYFAFGGDVSQGRLTKFPPVEHFHWIYIVPPILILILTRFGIPVSTSFLILTVFSTATLDKMLQKSLFGYFVAFVVAILVYRLVMATFEKRFAANQSQGIPGYWVGLQWFSTAFLWSQWLGQDLANIFVYAPSAGFNEFGVRTIDPYWLVGSLAWMVFILGMVFWRKGGKIQNIVDVKTNIHDIRSATIIDLMYGVILYVFKVQSNIPMSTTWVFLGLLAGREFALALASKPKTTGRAFSMMTSDIGKAAIGLVLSVAIAILAPYIKTLV